MPPTSSQATGNLSFQGQFPLTAPDLAVSGSPDNPSAGGIVDIDLNATETTSELQNLVQDLTNRLTEMPGSNLDFGDPNSRGVGIMMYLSATTVQFAGIAGRIDAEYEKDPRVSASQTTITTEADGTRLIHTQIECVSGVFGLTWAWSQAGVAPVSSV